MPGHRAGRGPARAGGPRGRPDRRRGDEQAARGRQRILPRQHQVRHGRAPVSSTDHRDGSPGRSYVAGGPRGSGGNGFPPGSGGSGGSSPRASTSPRGNTVSIARLQAAERASAADLVRRLATAPPALAQLLASIAASDATHVTALGG